MAVAKSFVRSVSGEDIPTSATDWWDSPDDGGIACPLDDGQDESVSELAGIYESCHVIIANPHPDPLPKGEGALSGRHYYPLPLGEGRVRAS
jgi:hypothetical protein